MVKNKKKINSIVIASHNSGKIREMLPFVKKLNTKIYLAKDFKLKEPKEDGLNFTENALKKSRYVYNKTKKISIADDSGLVIPSLKGKPGIFSSRWAGEKKNFNQAMKKVNSINFVELWGSGKPKREFLYVEDLADACVYLLNNIDAETLYDKMSISHINIGCGEDISISDFLYLVVPLI